ncbi:hypothetical protein OG897_36530 [Streptomyces sp. NBC_00237]|uniref:hypothetical protein n=1 Tax=Streptomyces sp. NBC_00237 TaxID=2975687 RepID=UPI00224FD8BC|nr:hypothetical protein [Streptomyces sp. NBC_00237]MCX5206895.1 hypothetical protein [Streptomyces sp. NBC_00237]
MKLELDMNYYRALVARARAWGRNVCEGKSGDDGGYSTETVLVTAMLALLGIAVIGVIVAKVMGKANGIDLG